jgi:hypothetical protein
MEALAHAVGLCFSNWRPAWRALPAGPELGSPDAAADWRERPPAPPACLVPERRDGRGLPELPSAWPGERLRQLALPATPAWRVWPAALVVPVRML